MSELNKRKVRLFVESVWNEGRLELIESLVADDYVGRVGYAALRGPDEVRSLVSRERSACPDLYVKLEGLVAEGDQVALRWVASSGRVPRCSGLTMVRLLAGKQVDSVTELTSLLRLAGGGGGSRA